MNHLHLLQRVKDIEGDFLEVGVFQGNTSKKLLHQGAKQGKRFHAVDSFEGMNEPSKHDGKQYPKGRLSFSINDYRTNLVTAHPWAIEDKIYFI